MRILLAVARYPWPSRRGDQLRALEIANLLAGDHAVTLLAPAPAAAVAPPPSALPFRLATYRAAPWAPLVGLPRAALGGEPLECGLYDNPDLSRQIRSLARQADLGILQLVRLAPRCGDFGDLPVIVDLIDSLSLNVGRRATLDRLLLRPLLAAEAGRLAAAEARLLTSAAVGLVVAERDRRALAAGLPETVARRLRVVPLSREPGPEPAAPDSRRPVVALTGNLGYFVNADAARWFLRRVWPELRRLRPEIELVLAGARPPRALARAARAAGATLVPEPSDLAAVLRRATVAVAPLRGGSGLPLKVLEAWAAGVPVVASPWAAAGTSGRPGEDLAVADAPAEWCREIDALLADPAARRRLAEGGRARLLADYSRERVRAGLASAVEAALDRRRVAIEGSGGTL